MNAPGDDSRANEPAEAGGASVSTSLLQRLKCQEPTAWQRLVYLYGPTVYGWCRHQRLSPEDAADVRQEVFLAVARAIGDFRRDRPGDTFRGWLWTITRNKLRNFRQRGANPAPAVGGTTAQEQLLQVPADESKDDEPPSVPAEASDLYHRALELVQHEFTERTWQAFWQVAVEGRPAAEVAEELGMSLGAVYIAKSRVRQRLRDELADLEPLPVDSLDAP